MIHALQPLWHVPTEESLVGSIAKISPHTWKNSLCATDATVAVATAVFSVMVVQLVMPCTAMDRMGNIV